MLLVMMLLTSRLACVCDDVCRSRLAGLFLQLLEKLSPLHGDVTGAQTVTSSTTSLPAAKSSSCRYSADDIQQLRYLTSKILQHINARGQ